MECADRQLSPIARVRCARALALGALLALGACDAEAPVADSMSETATTAPLSTGGGEMGSTGGQDDPTGDGSSSGAMDPEAGSSSEGGDDPPPSSTSGDPEPPPVMCQAGALPPGRYPGVTLEHGGRTRSYDLYVPESVDVTQPTPLVLNFHGLYGNPGQQALFSQYDAAAAAAGVIVAYPAGISNSWNTGLCCGGAQDENVDDVGFAKTVVQHIGLGSCIDTTKVFAIGLSNGGHMAHRLACEAADVFAGVASVAGVLTMLQCNPSRPISVQQFHGTSDNIVRYDGWGPGFPPVDDMMAQWASRNGCAPVPEISHDEGDSTCETYVGCDAGVEVTLCTVDGGGHCWPGNPSCTFGSSTTDVSANDVIARMLQTQSLPD